MQAAIIEFPTTFSRQELEDTIAGIDDGLRLGRPDLALKIIDLTLQLVPDHPALLYRRAVALSALGRVVDALEAYERMIALKIEDAEFDGRLRMARAELLMQLTRFPEALDDSKRAIALCPDVPEILLGHARALAFNKHGDAAIDAYDDIIERHKTLNFEHSPIGIGPIILERDAIVRLFLESDVA